MSQILEEQLSAFLDGELPAEELELLLARLDRAPGSRARLARYAMVGECMRSGSASIGALDIAERVRSTLLAAEPAAPATARTGRGPWPGWVAAGVAATAALVALLSTESGSWRSVGPVLQEDAAISIAAAEEPLVDIVPAANHRLSPRAAARLTGYLVAHGQYTNELSRSTFDSHLVSARAERASWRQTQGAGNVR